MSETHNQPVPSISPADFLLAVLSELCDRMDDQNYQAKCTAVLKAHAADPAHPLSCPLDQRMIRSAFAAWYLHVGYDPADVLRSPCVTAPKPPWAYQAYFALQAVAAREVEHVGRVTSADWKNNQRLRTAAMHRFGCLHEMLLYVAGTVQVNARAGEIGGDGQPILHQLVDYKGTHPVREPHFQGFVPSVPNGPHVMIVVSAGVPDVPPAFQGTANVEVQRYANQFRPATAACKGLDCLTAIASLIFN